MWIVRSILLLVLALIASLSKGQISLSDTASVNTATVLLKKEKSGFVMIHTSGFGVGYRNGKHLTGYKKRMFEIELTGLKNPKEARTVNQYYDNAKSYIFGKENSFLVIRGGLGRQKIINSKPYWGGVELRYFYYGGISLGLLKPYYLYILNESTNAYEYYLTIEKYDHSKYGQEDIFGKAPYFYGFGNIKPMPGIYFKTGLNFEYGAYSESLKAIEAGIAVDGYLKKVPIMAITENRNYFVSLYLSFHFGTRGN